MTATEMARIVPMNDLGHPAENGGEDIQIAIERVIDPHTIEVEVPRPTLALLQIELSF